MLELASRPGHGGKRRGAGRKPKGDRAGVSHRPRAGLAAAFPVHVTMRARAHVWNLRSRRAFGVVGESLAAIRERAGFRVVHFSVQGNHLHCLAEADTPDALARGIQALSIRLAKGLNRMMSRRGAVWADRYHARVLRTPAEVRNALAYVLGNFASHARRRGERVAEAFVDPFSSAGEGRALVREPTTWLLSRGWARVRRS